jgi:hypothetical protein
MKQYIKPLSEFITEADSPKRQVATTVTGAESEEGTVEIQPQDPVQNFGVWAQTFGDTNSPSGYADPIIAQSKLYGMTPQEYIAYYGSRSEQDTGA